MRRIYMTLALIAGLGVTAFAQNIKEADLEIKWVNPIPEPGQNDNLGPNDTMTLAFSITNHGPEAVDSTDTLNFVIGTRILGNDVYNYLHLFTAKGPSQGINIPVGGIDTLYLRLPNGIKFFNNSEAKVKFPTDAKVCHKIAIFGYNKDQYYFQDDGFIPQTYNQIMQNAGDISDLNSLWDAFMGNNIDDVTILFGSGEADFCSEPPAGINGLKEGKVGLTIYPNPASDNIHLDFAMDRTVNNAQVRISDVTGRTVMTQNMGKVAAGEHNVTLDVSSLTSGLYFVQLNADGMRGVAKFTVTK